MSFLWVKSLSKKREAGHGEAHEREHTHTQVSMDFGKRQGGGGGGKPTRGGVFGLGGRAGRKLMGKMIETTGKRLGREALCSRVLVPSSNAAHPAGAGGVFGGPEKRQGRTNRGRAPPAQAGERFPQWGGGTGGPSPSLDTERMGWEWNFGGENKRKECRRRLLPRRVEWKNEKKWRVFALSSCCVGGCSFCVGIAFALCLFVLWRAFVSLSGPSRLKDGTWKKRGGRGWGR